MKYIVSVIALSTLSTFSLNAMYQLDKPTTEHLTTMLKNISRVAQEHQLKKNPAARVYSDMQDTIDQKGVPALVARSGVKKWMDTMHSTYTKDRDYVSAIAKAKSLQHTDSKYRNALASLPEVGQTPIMQVTESNSSFKCPRFKNGNVKEHYLSLLTSNANANADEHADILIASTLICLVQHQEQQVMLQEAHKKK